jgi:hypothetical protein
VTRITFESAARAELQAAMTDHRALAPQLAARIAAERGDAVRRAEAMPQAMPAVSMCVRTCRLRRSATHGAARAFTERSGGRARFAMLFKLERGMSVSQQIDEALR